MAPKNSFNSEYNYYEIIATLRKFLERAHSANINEAFLLRAELLSYIFSVDILKKRYIGIVNETISLLEEKNTITTIERITENIAKKTSNSTENDYPVYLYYPSIWDYESKIIVQESLRAFYSNNFSLNSIIFGFNLVHIEYYILSKPFLTSFFKSANFDVAYLSTINLTVITSLIYYIECQFASFYYVYNTEKFKKDLLKKINNDKYSKRLKRIIKTIVVDPHITLDDLAFIVDDVSKATIKRDLVLISKYGYNPGELNAVKELIMTYGFTVKDLD